MSKPIESLEELSSSKRVNRWEEAQKTFYDDPTQRLEDIADECGELLLKSSRDDRKLKVTWQHAHQNQQLSYHQDKQAQYDKTKLLTVAAGSFHALFTLFSGIPVNAVLTPIALAGQVSQTAYAAATQAAGKGADVMERQFNTMGQAKQEEAGYFLGRAQELAREASDDRQRDIQDYNTILNGLLKIDAAVQQAMQSVSAGASS